MTTTRRDLLKTGALAATGLAVPALIARAFAAEAPKAAKPLRILILGGTGFIGPHQVRYALARGHKLTLFNRGKNPQAWPGEVEELLGDRNTGDLQSLAGRDWDVHRQSDHAVVLGARCRQGSDWKSKTVYFYLDGVGVRRRQQARPGRGRGARAPIAARTRWPKHRRC